MNRNKKYMRIYPLPHNECKADTPRNARRKCFGYRTSPDGTLVISPDEASIVRWIFEQYISGDSLRKIAEALETEKVPSPAGKSKWSRETVNKIISNEKYICRLLIRKAVRLGGAQTQHGARILQFLCSGMHEAIVSEEIFHAAQQEKLRRNDRHTYGSFSQRLL